MKKYILLFIIFCNCQNNNKETIIGVYCFSENLSSQYNSQYYNEEDNLIIYKDSTFVFFNKVDTVSKGKISYHEDGKLDFIYYKNNMTDYVSIYKLIKRNNEIKIVILNDGGDIVFEKCEN
jgi:hypothetical protein